MLLKNLFEDTNGFKMVWSQGANNHSLIQTTWQTMVRENQGVQSGTHIASVM